ncbi:DUF2795 domain-containing protein [Streptomyces sp. NPDC054849]
MLNALKDVDFPAGKKQLVDAAHRSDSSEEGLRRSAGSRPSSTRTARTWPGRSGWARLRSRAHHRAAR